jgi:hypothetical protein
LAGHIEPEHRSGERTNVMLGFIASGQVLRPSSSQPVVRTEGNRPAVAILAQHVPRVTMELCCCSILAICWDVAYPQRDPQAIAQGAAREAERLHDIPPMTAGRTSLSFARHSLRLRPI